MDRVNRILHHEKYKDYIARINKAEKDRQFCCHNMGHFLDVARLAVILDQTEGYGQEKELIYGAALLHDIGRWMEYEDGISHEKASVMLAPEILDDCGFSEEEKIVTFGSVSVNITARTVSKNGEPVLLSLREKLGDDPAKPAYIKTVYKVGNLLEAKG